MRLRIDQVDFAPPEMHAQLPLDVSLLRCLADPAGQPVWLGAVETPIRWKVDDGERRVTHLLVAPRWIGTAIRSGAHELTLNIAYVTTPEPPAGPRVDAAMCEFVAIGICDVID